MDLNLAGKRAIVTGGSRGIGKAIARQLAQEGVDIVIAARGREALEATAAQLAAETGRRIIPVVADTSDDRSVRALAAAAVAALGGVDILINNAAVTASNLPGKTLDSVTRDALFHEIDVKVMGYLRTAQAVAPSMIASGWGRIVNIGGMSYRRTGNYIASARNAGVVAMTKNLADELGPQGVTVNAIHPGPTVTESARTRTPDNTIGRMVDSSEIAWLATMLASPGSIAVNGASIPAAGGWAGVIDY